MIHAAASAAATATRVRPLVRQYARISSAGPSAGMNQASTTSTSATPMAGSWRSAGQRQPVQTAAATASTSDTPFSTCAYQAAPWCRLTSRVSSPTKPPPTLAPSMKVMPDQKTRPSSTASIQPVDSDSRKAAMGAPRPSLKACFCSQWAPSHRARASIQARYSCVGSFSKIQSRPLSTMPSASKPQATTPSSTRSQSRGKAAATTRHAAHSSKDAVCAAQSRNSA